MKKKSPIPKKSPPSSDKKIVLPRTLTMIRLSVGIVATLFLVSVMYFRFFATNAPCANSISCKEVPRLEIVMNARGVYNNQSIYVPNISQSDSINPVLGVKTSTGEKHIYVNLDTQTLTAYEGDAVFMQTPVSTGLWGRTPKGDFTIWLKFRATRMSGGSGADYYDLPNVPYVMFFSNDEVAGSRGFSIHGTYWHNNFGHAMSHGCINMKTSDVAKLYEWADRPSDGEKGTTITIYDDSLAK